MSHCACGADAESYQSCSGGHRVLATNLTLDAAGLAPLARALLGSGLSLWLGGGLALLRGTSALFAAAPTRREGGVYSGALLASFRAWQALAVVLCGLGALLGARGAGLLFAAAAALALVASLPADAALRKLRAQIGGTTEGLPAGDPRRKTWGRLHGLSVLLLLAQVSAAGVGLWLLLLRGR